MPNPDEVATMMVEGFKFENFESVWVEHEWGSGTYPMFRFTTADIVEVPGTPPPKNWQTLQLKPGVECAIYLGGNLAVSGIITLRQTAYDANNKGVQFQGVGVQWAAARSSIEHKTGSLDGKGLVAAANEVLAPTGVPAKVIGVVDPTPFKNMQVQHGEQIGHFLDRITRPRNVVLGSDHLGNILLIGDHGNPIAAYLTEGINILKCQATIWYENIFSKYIVDGQSGGGDDLMGRAAAEQRAVLMGTLQRYSARLTPIEQPVGSVAEIMKRVQAEAKWSEATKIVAIITTQGWMMPGTHSLWPAGGNVQVTSPMAMLDMVMKIKKVTFAQDRNAGTTTTMELVPPWGLNDHAGFDLRNPTAPQPPGAPTADTAAAATPAPPAQTPDPHPETLK